MYKLSQYRIIKKNLKHNKLNHQNSLKNKSKIQPYLKAHNNKVILPFPKVPSKVVLDFVSCYLDIGCLTKLYHLI